MYKPNVEITLAPSYNSRAIAGFTNVISNAKDQRKINCMYEPYVNPASGQKTFYLVKRPGVTDTGSTYGTSGQVAYLVEVGAGALTNAAANRWVFSTSGSDVRASDASTTTVVVTAAGYAPVYVDKTAITGVDTLVVQLRNSTGTQRVFYSTALGTFTEITDTDFTTLAHQGKAEHLDGYMFIGTRNRIYSSNLNSVSVWEVNSYIDRRVTQDIGTGLAKFGPQILSFGTSTMEVFRNAGNPTGSPLEAVPQLSQDYGMASPAVVGMRHYCTLLNNRLFWVGSHPTGVFAYNGQTVEKVSTVAIDKILAERQHYNVGVMSFQGKHAIAICLDLPDATPQRSLVFFPDWNDWFEWHSTVFIAQASTRLSDICLGVGSNQHKLYQVSSTSDNWQDAGTSYEFLTQFMLPRTGQQRQFMPMCGVIGDTASGVLNLGIQFSDDDYGTFSTARSVDLNSGQPYIFGCGSYTRGRAVRLSYTGSLEVRLERFVAKIK